MDDNKEKRYNEDKWLWETKEELWLSEYDKYVLTTELEIRIFQIEATRDKVGISANDKDAESNKHIETLRKILKQLEE